MMKINKRLSVIAGICVSGMAVSAAHAEQDSYDLDDIRAWPIVSVETCLDAAYDTMPGAARKLEMKLEGDDPVYEFDIQVEDGTIYNVECNAEEGMITEIEREASPNDPVFKKYAKLSEAEAKEIALDFVPGQVRRTEYEVGMDGSVTYEFDILMANGREYKVDIDAVTGELEEANLELYEIGGEAE
jgi:uncharacterized membrane protein YkoI